MNDLQYLIVFSKPCASDEMKNFIGFGMFTKSEAEQYMKAVKSLEAADCSFDFEDLSLLYSRDDFTKMKLTQAERKLLQKIFGVEAEDCTFGVFPDATNDAVDFGVVDEYADEDSRYDDGYEEDEEY